MRSCARAAWLLAALAGPMLAGARPAAAQGRPTVALLDFEFGTIQRWWEGDWDIGKGTDDVVRLPRHDHR